MVEGEEMEEADENENEVNIDDIVDRAEAVEVSLARALFLPPFSLSLSLSLSLAHARARSLSLSRARASVRAGATWTDLIWTDMH